MLMPEVHKVMLHIKALGLVASKKIFSCFAYISICKTYDPGQGHFGPRGII